MRYLPLLALLVGCRHNLSTEVGLALEGPPAIAEYFPRLVLEVEVENESASGQTEAASSAPSAAPAPSETADP